MTAARCALFAMVAALSGCIQIICAEKPEVIEEMRQERKKCLPRPSLLEEGSTRQEFRTQLRLELARGRKRFMEGR